MRLNKVIGIMLAGVATPALAQSASNEQRIDDDIVVVATGESSAMSSTKTDTPIIEAPQSISIISREEIDLRASPTIADALSYTAGVQAEAFGIDSRVDEVSVRGFGPAAFRRTTISSMAFACRRAGSGPARASTRSRCSRSRC